MPVSPQPPFDHFGMMDAEIVNDHMQFPPPGLHQQRFQKSMEHPIVEAALAAHETELSPAGDRTDQIDLLIGWIVHPNGRPPFGRIASPPMVVALQAGLVAPVDLGAL